MKTALFATKKSTKNTFRLKGHTFSAEEGVSEFCGDASLSLLGAEYVG